MFVKEGCSRCKRQFTLANAYTLAYLCGSWTLILPSSPINVALKICHLLPAPSSHPVIAFMDTVVGIITIVYDKETVCLWSAWNSLLMICGPLVLHDGSCSSVSPKEPTNCSCCQLGIAYQGRLSIGMSVVKTPHSMNAVVMPFNPLLTTSSA